MAKTTVNTNQLKQILNDVPGLDCTGCWGECCVSPTMTYSEFVVMMNNFTNQQSETTQKKRLLQTPTEHKQWHGTHYCIFQNQESGRCENYQGRALACRLHGHDAMKAFENPNYVFCDKAPDKMQSLSVGALEEILNFMRISIEESPLPYHEPWFFSSLNLDSWLDFYYLPQISEGRTELMHLYNDMHSNIKLPDLKWKARTTLSGKLNAVESVYQSLQANQPSRALSLLASLQEEYPSVGSYFIDEAEMLRSYIKTQFTVDESNE